MPYRYCMLKITYSLGYVLGLETPLNVFSSFVKSLLLRSCRRYCVFEITSSLGYALGLAWKLFWIRCYLSCRVSWLYVEVTRYWKHVGRIFLPDFRLILTLDTNVDANVLCPRPCYILLCTVLAVSLNRNLSKRAKRVSSVGSCKKGLVWYSYINRNK